ncbi:MAG: hypothetical protein KKG33_00850 [candidate division Zixibacteria bacterium]|nr:hypothetical protein [candidate division Zixibacteria bacterium]MBU1471107.1 hypothetical protein [candidate division Zixibacteria bacterium]MBU2624087.1 hypothetical protein [candidate division Zixibacteria bacterium]
MIHRSVFLPAAIILASVTILPLCTVIAADTNDEFVRRSLESYFTEALAMFPAIPSGQIYIDYSPPAIDNLNVSGSALSAAVRTNGMVRSFDSSSGVGLQFSLRDIQFRYDSRDGGLFTRGDICRVLSVSGRFSVVEENASIWEDYLVREYSEQIDLSEKEEIERNSSQLFNAELPPGPIQKVWEPVIVTSIVGGLVYLFFASR